MYIGVGIRLKNRKDPKKVYFKLGSKATATVVVWCGEPFLYWLALSSSTTKIPLITLLKND